MQYVTHDTMSAPRLARARLVLRVERLAVVLVERRAQLHALDHVRRRQEAPPERDRVRVPGRHGLLAQLGVVAPARGAACDACVLSTLRCLLPLQQMRCRPATISGTPPDPAAGHARQPARLGAVQRAVRSGLQQA